MALNGLLCADVPLTLMLLVANIVDTKYVKKKWEIHETLSNGYPFETTQREHSNGYPHDRVWMVFKNICVFGRK